MRPIIKKLLHQLGIDVRLVRNIRKAGLTKYEDKELAHWSFLQHHNISTVLDIGANTGQFAALIHKACPGCRILSFEPLSDCYEELQRNLAGLAKAEAFNFALGESARSTKINHSAFSPSSSLLEMTPLHKRNWPESADNTEECIEVKRLDDVTPSLNLKPNLLIKMDVQGFEDRVLRGGIETVKQARLIVTEINFEPLYREQADFDKIYEILRPLGFTFHGIVEQYRNWKDGRILFADVIFSRP